MSTTDDTPYVVWFDRYVEDDRPRVGGKNASLGTMLGAGLPVPPGFAVTTDAFDTLREHGELRACVNDVLDNLDHDDTAALRVASEQVRASIEALPLPEDVAEAIRTAYSDLCEHCLVEDVPVAVRSSATAEDLPDASFAGQQDTYLWIRGADEVLDHVRQCWSSLFTDRAISYRRRTGHDQEDVSMSVGIQKMVQPRAAGVAFTLDPANGDRSQVAIDAAWGLGESVVSGEVTPDSYRVDKVMREVTSRSISSKQIEYRVAGDHVEKADVDPDRVDEPCLTDDEVCAVAAMARRAEQHYGCPQDVEWAVDQELPEGENIVLLQARPETVWSQRERSRPDHESGMDSIVSTLTKPLADRRT